MSFVLLAWENVPESIEFFRLPEDHAMVETAKASASIRTILKKTIRSSLSVSSSRLMKAKE